MHSIAPDAAERPEGGFYVTPPVATRRLLDAEPIAGPAWEPACGDGAISEVLRERGLRVHSADLHDRGYGRGGVDFLERPRVRFRFRTIVANPPFSRAQAFAEAALSYASAEKVVLLARLLWLEGKKRREFFLDTRLTHVWVHSSRVNVARRGQDWGDGGEGGMIAFAWFVWDRGDRGPTAAVRWPPTIGWLP